MTGMAHLQPCAFLWSMGSAVALQPWLSVTPTTETRGSARWPMEPLRATESHIDECQRRRRRSHYTHFRTRPRTSPLTTTQVHPALCGFS